jgi:hypothetical protein
MSPTQYEQGYLRADGVIRNKPPQEDLAGWVWHPDNRPLPSDSADFRAGYTTRAREVGAVCPLVVK